MSDFFDIPKLQKVYPPLFARTSTGAVQVWWMEQDGEKFRSTSGQNDGVKTASDWTTATRKNIGRTNSVSAEAQSTSEIKAKYDKQLKSGGYWLDEKDIDKERFFQVMLAKSFGDYKDDIDWSKGVGVQIKYNGGRIIAKADGLWSRKGEKYENLKHIEDSLKPLFTKFPDAILDGEGYNFELREKLNEIMKLLRKTVHITDDDRQKSKEMIRFYIYDGWNLPVSKDGLITKQSDCYLIRKSGIDNAFFAPCFKERYKDIIGKVPTWVVKSEKELDNLYQKFLSDKQEGAILRILGEGYVCKRSKLLLKYKPVDSVEYKIISVQDGVGKFSNRVATVTCKRIDGKKYLDGTDTFDATFKGEHEDAVKAWNDKDSLIGQIVTIIYNGNTGFGKPNYARLDWNNYLHDK